MTLSLSFVIPWFDPSGSTGGGAEALCRAYASRLSRAGHDVEVLTTCSRDHDADWYSNGHPAGPSKAAEGYSVVRFPVRRGDRDRFLDLNRRILHGQPLSFREERSFLENSVQSDELSAAVADRVGRRTVIALPYLFGTTWRCLMEHPGKVVLWPCLHDEGYARLKLLAEAHARAAAVVFNSEAERALAVRLYGTSRPSVVVGMGVNAPPEELSAGESAASVVREPFFVCLGRQSPEKGTPRLMEMFRLFAAGCDRDVRLVLAGKGGDPAQSCEAVLNRGFISEEEKDALLQTAVAAVLPSARESFSIALLEALARGTPVLVNGSCDVTRDHVVRGQCGLWYRDEAEFEECATLLLENPDLRARLGANGREYVRRNFSWEGRVKELVGFLEGVVGR